MNIIIKILFCITICFSMAFARPDSAGIPPEGFAYGGIPYGSMSGNVAEYYKMKESLGHHFQHYTPQPVVHYPNFYQYYHH